VAFIAGASTTTVSLEVIDQQLADAGLAHFGEGDFLRVGGHGVRC
jgi:hypothetical protein